MNNTYQFRSNAFLLTLNLGVSLSYWCLAKVSLFFAFNPGNITIFWMPGGFGLAVLLFQGQKLLPGIFLGALLAGITDDIPLKVSIYMALGNTLESLCAYWLLKHNPHANCRLNRTHDFFRLLFFGAALSTLISALIGSLTLYFTETITQVMLPAVFLRWWMADALGIAFAAPLFLIWFEKPHLNFNLQHNLEMTALFVLSFLIGQATFLDWFYHPDWRIEPSWILPFVIWSGLRGGRHLTALLQLMLFSQSIWGASHGIGYYADGMAKNGLVNFWLYGMIIAVGGMLLAIITYERKLAGKEQARLHKTIAASLNEIYLFNAETLRFTFVNRGGLENLGYTLEEMKTLTPLDLQTRLSPLQFQNYITPLLNHSLPSIRFETEHTRKNGTHYPIEVHLQLFTEDGERYFHAVVLNISERKQAEQTLLAAKRMAEESTRLKSEFLANMSHEIRTPMNAIIGISELALNQEVSANVRLYLEKIRTASDNLLTILNDILDFSKIESHCMHLEKTCFKLSGIIDDLNNLFSLRARQKQITLTFIIKENVPFEMIGDQLRIQQILTNLLSNAIKFTEQGKVTLSISVISQENGKFTLHFQVDDTGIGMSETDLSKLFQPFSQVDGTITRRFGGTGLGLAISQALLQLMGSRFQVNSVPRQGSCFSFDLTLDTPVYNSQSLPAHKQPRDAGSLSNQITQIGHSLHNTVVLVAEDNETNQIIIQDILALSGINAIIAVNGKQVLKLLETTRFDAILMDIQMPEMGGIETTQYIRQDSRYAKLPILALTAGVTLEEQENCLASGINDFIAKPFTAEALISKLAKWITPDKSIHTDPKTTGT